MSNRKLGEMTAHELLRSAGEECLGLSEHIDKISDRLSEDDRVLLKAYVGSIWTRVQVAHDTLTTI